MPNELTEEEIDEIVESEADDDSAWGEAIKVDRTAFSVGRLSDDSDNMEYWLSKTPEERHRHMEVLRRMN